MKHVLKWLDETIEFSFDIDEAAIPAGTIAVEEGYSLVVFTVDEPCKEIKGDDVDGH